MPESSVLNARRLGRRRDGVIALVVMASLPSPMRKRLAVVNNDGNGAKGNNDDNGTTGNNEVDDPDYATDDEVVDDDGDGMTDNDINDDCNGATGDDNNNDGDGDGDQR